MLQELHDEKDEYGCIGAGIGTGIDNTQEFKVLDYDGAMASDDSAKWEASVEQEHDQMVKNKVWKFMRLEDVLKDVDIIDLTWAMKKKANGDYRADWWHEDSNRLRENPLCITTYLCQWSMISPCASC